MRSHAEDNEIGENKHDGLLIFLSFLGSAMAGYILMNHYALFGF